VIVHVVNNFLPDQDGNFGLFASSPGVWLNEEATMIEVDTLKFTVNRIFSS
jgi:hypothetical protein